MSVQGGAQAPTMIVDVAYSRGVRVVVDGSKCQGHNRCYTLAPELFDVDEIGNAVVIGDGLVTAALAPKAQLAVANCPEFAITIEP